MHEIVELVNFTRGAPLVGPPPWATHFVVGYSVYNRWNI